MTIMRSLLMQTRVRIAVAATLLVLVLFYGLISFFIAQGVTTAERNPQEDHPSNYGLSAEDVEFTVRDGDLRLSGWYIQGEEEAPHLIFVHGLNNVRSGDHAVQLAARLVEFGYSILMFDQRGHGSSEGSQVSGGYYERWDVWGAYDYVIDQQGGAKGKIGLLGYSMGGVTSILAAGDEPGIRAVVADSPFATASELIAQEAARTTPFPKWIMPIFIPTVKLMGKGIYGIDIGALDAVAGVARLDYPVLIIHSTKDERVPLSHGERVAAAGRTGILLWRAGNEGHTESFNAYPDEYAKLVNTYFADLLK